MHWVKVDEFYQGHPDDKNIAHWEYRNTKDILVGSVDYYGRSDCHCFEIYDNSGAVVSFGENNGDNDYNTLEFTKSTVELLAREFGVAEE